MSVIYEQALNEAVRICLQFESWQQSFKDFMLLDNRSASQMALTLVVQMLKLLERPDLKSRLLQTLSQFKSTLNQLQRHSEVEPSYLQQTRETVNQCIEQFHRAQGKFGHALLHNEFLNTLKLQFNKTGCLMGHDSHNLQFWLQQTSEQRKDQLQNWFNEFQLLLGITTVILRLIRESAEPTQQIAHDGFYQQALNPNLPWQMVRLELSCELPYLPDISVGKHRASVHFLQTDFMSNERLKNVKTDIPFKICFCQL